MNGVNRIRILRWHADIEKGEKAMAKVREVGELYRCEVCGNVVDVREVGGGELICCEEPMTLEEDEENAEE